MYIYDVGPDAWKDPSQPNRPEITSTKIPNHSSQTPLAQFMYTTQPGQDLVAD